MATDLAKFAEENGVKYFMISFTDLFGGQRAKLVPARAIADMQEDGAGFAGFATWLDMTPAHPDMLAVPDPEAAVINCLGTKSCMGSRQLRHGGRGSSPKRHAMCCAADRRGRLRRHACKDRDRGRILSADPGRETDFR